MRRFFADITPLRNTDFRRLWLAGVVTVIGAGLTLFAVPVQIYALTQSSAYVGLTGVFGLVPLVVFGLWGGALADRMDRRTLLIITATGLAASSVLLWLQAALSVDNVWVVLCLLSVQQGFFAINSPTRAAAIPRMLPLEQLPAANALNMTVQQFGFIAGPLLAGVLLKWVDLSTLYLIDAIACVAPIWATVRLHKMPPTGASKDLRANGSGLQDVLDGFRYLAGHKIVLMSFVVDLVAMIFGMPRILFPQIAHEGFGDPADGGTVIALLSAAISVGAVIGGVFSGWFQRIDRQGLAVVVSIVVWGLAMVGFGLTAHAPLLWLALLFLVIGGIADMVSAAFRTTILQSVATDDVRGRLQGVFTVVVAGGPRVADFTHGAAAAAVGTTAAAAGGGALVVVGVIVAALVVPVFVRFRTSTEAQLDPQ
ncbi:MFS transporter permease [Mycobacteroides abscessus]|nr:MFS transporter permease [Mycobacteroides abscessus subsp. massiliense str. GO 06]AMU24867.1 MFS transporter permease [Mycobacteroides abscessus]AMU34596.1 MFS transporter permease [Mycobacteroides abscessus]AMU39594.1 MFS transporter permease [Mycobacteroides abscessus]AMU59586.1 MFS transporter permease [Mycobacteroides abscessus]